MPRKKNEEPVVEKKPVAKKAVKKAEDTVTKKAPAKAKAVKETTKKSVKESTKKEVKEPAKKASKSSTKKAVKAEEKPVAKKAVAKKTTRKASPKKSLPVEPEVKAEEPVLIDEEVLKPVEEEVKTEVEEVKAEVKEETVYTEPVLEEASEPVEKKKKPSIILRVLVTILIVIALLLAGTFTLYKCTVDVAAKNEDKFDFVLANEPTETNYDLLSFISYRSEESDCIKVSIPKPYIYEELVNIRKIFDDVQLKYDVKVNRFGFTSDPENKNLINIYADITYKGLINGYATGVLEYVFTEDNGIDIVYRNLTVGDGFPELFYKSFIPFKDGDVVYSLKGSDYDILKENIVKLNTVRNISIDKDSVNFDFDIGTNIKSISSFIFGEDAKKYEQCIDSFLPIVLELLIGEDKGSYMDLAQVLFPILIDEFLSDPTALFADPTPEAQQG